MTTVGEKFRALLATGRVANLPTVWSNVLVAFWLSTYCNKDLAGISTYHVDTPRMSFWLLGSALLSSSFLYLGGCLLGDYKDAKFDSKHRPTRPIPSGVISGTMVMWLAISSFVLAAIIAITSTHAAPRQPHHGLFLATLSALIISYAIFHKKNKPLALVNMGLCRSFLWIFAMAMPIIALNDISGTAPSFSILSSWLNIHLLTVAACVGLYTFCLSSVAATESNHNPFSYRKLLFLGMISLPVIAVYALKGIAPFPHHGLMIGGCLAIYVAWLVYGFIVLPNSKPAFVSKALAGFCLLDACIASTFSLPITFICLGLFGLALLLQKVTPAT